MSTIIQLPTTLAQKLQHQANKQRLSLSEFVINFLNQANFTIQETTDFDSDYYDLDNVVARIQALPPNPAAIHPPTASLADALLSLPDDPTFNLAEWKQQWALAEAEIEALNAS